MAPQTTASPRKKGGRASGAKKKPTWTRCLITLLPPELYPSIFAEAIDHGNFVLCRALLPYTLVELYRTVELFNRTVLAQFAAAIMRRPWLANEVRKLALRDEDTIGRPYRPKDIVVGVGLIKDMLRLLDHLVGLAIEGLFLFRTLFGRDFLEDKPFPRVATLLLTRDLSEVGYETLADAELLHNLRCLPRLEQLSLQGGETDLPVDLLNLGPQLAVPARSLALQSFTIMGHDVLGSDLRIALAGLSDHLRTIKIEALEVYAGFMHDLALLPPSVTEVEFMIGIPCPDRDYSETPPKLADVAWHLPNLASLHLAGNIINSATFDLVYNLPRLEALEFNYHTAVEAQPLLSLLRGGPSTWPRIRRLAVSICQCPPEGTPFSRRQRSDKPNWPPHFGEADARELLRICDAKDIAIGGTVVCAFGVCVPDGTHGCPEWVKAKDADKALMKGRRKRM